MATIKKRKTLLDAKTMDGPSIAFVPVFDLLKPISPRLAFNYHVMWAGYDFLTPLGTAVGGLLHASTLYQPYSTALATMGTGGLIAGGAGMALGLVLKTAMSMAPPEKQKLPFNSDGIQTRVDGLSHNFAVRLMDLSVWNGIAAAAVGLYVAGGPAKLGLSPGKLGVAQALSLGSALGGVSGMVCLFATSKTKYEEDDD